ncbi:unnamed protein product [Amoebophrya sp. A120]|nr:unnamed protein product [Amoebophrya sp. A120]|eukprot:GSA120T00018587001.1
MTLHSASTSHLHFQGHVLRATLCLIFSLTHASAIVWDHPAAGSSLSTTIPGLFSYSANGALETSAVLTSDSAPAPLDAPAVATNEKNQKQGGKKKQELQTTQAKEPSSALEKKVEKQGQEEMKAQLPPGAVATQTPPGATPNAALSNSMTNLMNTPATPGGPGPAPPAPQAVPATGGVQAGAGVLPAAQTGLPAGAEQASPTEGMKPAGGEEDNKPCSDKECKCWCCPYCMLYYGLSFVGGVLLVAGVFYCLRSGGGGPRGGAEQPVAAEV